MNSQDMLLQLQSQVYRETRTAHAPLGNLMPWLVDRRNLEAALERVADSDGASTPGLDGVIAAQVTAHPGAWLAKLADQLMTNTYQPQAPRWVEVPKSTTLLLRHNVQVAWLTPGGSRCHGRLVRAQPSSTLLRVHQHQTFADAGHRLTFARDVVQRKIRSQIDAARHYQRQGRTASLRSPLLRQLKIFLDNAASARDLDCLRGMEGAASAVWFNLFGKFIRSPWTFQQRTRRPPTDPVNALLSLGYTCLSTRIVARCEAVGLETALGALHDYRAGRPSLACDLIEPLRVPVVDRWVLMLCNEQRLTPDCFRTVDGGVKLQPAQFPQVLAWWEEHWDEIAAAERITTEIDALVRFIRRPVLPPMGRDGPVRIPE